MDAVLIGGIALAALVFLIDGKAPGAKGGSEDRPLERAVFAGGCFWCMQPAFDRLKGVISTAVGYTGGEVENPSYEQVCSGKTGHVEAIEIVFDPSIITFRELIETFWKNIDPTQPNGQFADTGAQYRTVIYYHDESQKRAAEASRQELESSGKFGRRIVTDIEPAKQFYRAEEHHQEYYLKNPTHYTFYKKGSGRESFLERVWGKKD